MDTDILLISTYDLCISILKTLDIIKNDEKHRLFSDTQSLFREYRLITLDHDGQEVISMKIIDNILNFFDNIGAHIDIRDLPPVATIAFGLVCRHDIHNNLCIYPSKFYQKEFLPTYCETTGKSIFYAPIINKIDTLISILTHYIKQFDTDLDVKLTNNDIIIRDKLQEFIGDVNIFKIKFEITDKYAQTQQPPFYYHTYPHYNMVFAFAYKHGTNFYPKNDIEKNMIIDAFIKGIHSNIPPCRL